MICLTGLGFLALGELLMRLGKEEEAVCGGGGSVASGRKIARVGIWMIGRIILVRGGIVEDAGDSVEGVGGDGGIWRGVGSVVDHGHEGGGVGRGGEGDRAADEGGETSARSEAGARGETCSGGEASAEVSGVELGGLRVLGRLWAGKHGWGQGSSAEGAGEGGVGIVPSIGRVSGAGDGGEGGEDGAGRG